jgi:hypothetical protein
MYGYNNSRQAGGTEMGKAGIAVLLSVMMALAFNSLALAQSAEDMVKGQSPGIRFTRLFVDVCSRTTLTIDIRGDEVTYGERIDWAERGCVPSNMVVGVWKALETARVTGKYMNGNKLVLETDSRLYVTKVIIDGHRLTQCMPAAGGQLQCGGDWNRER